MGGVNERKLLSKYEHPKNIDWRSNINIRTLKNVLSFVDLLTLKQNMKIIPKKLHCVLYESVSIRKFKRISIQCVEEHSYLPLLELLKTQEEIEKLELTFDFTLTGTYSLNDLCNTLLTYCSKIESIHLENWAYSSYLEVDGILLSRLVKKVNKFRIGKISIQGFSYFINALKENTTLSKFYFQSRNGFTSTEIRQLYNALNNKTRLKKVRILDRYASMQVDWNELANLIKDTKCLRAITLDALEIKIQIATHIVAKSLTANTSLKRVCFKYCEAFPLNVRLLESLEEHCSLKVLDLSYIPIHSRAHMSALCKVIQNNSLRSVILKNIFTAKDESRISCKELIVIIAEHKTLEQVDISCNIFNKEEEQSLVHIIYKSKTIRELDYKQSSLNEDTMISIFSSLQDNQTLTRLSLSTENSYTENLNIGIIEFINKNKTLKLLLLNGNTLINTERIYKALANSSLEVFSVTDEVVDCLFESLGVNLILSDLEVESKGFSMKAFEILVESLSRNCSLKRLKLIGKFECQASLCLSEGLKKNKGIRHIELCESGIRKDEGMSFISFLKENATLETLQLSSNAIEISDSDINTLIECLRCNNNLKLLIFGKDSVSGLAAKELKKVINCWLRVEVI